VNLVFLEGLPICFVIKLENIQIVNYYTCMLKELLNGNNGVLLILTLNNIHLD